MKVSFACHLAVLLSGPLSLVRAEAEGPTAQPRWGPFRSNLYFGLRPRVKESVLTGLMWTRVENGELVEQDLRHSAEQAHGMAGFGWQTYDHKDGGTQIMHDVANKVDITTDFLQVMSEYDCWAARVKGELRSDAPKDQNTTLIFYVGIEDQRPSASMHCKKLKGMQQCTGATPDLGTFAFNFKAPASTKQLSAELYGGSVDPGSLWQAPSIFLSQLKTHLKRDTLQSRNNANMYFVHTTFQGNFELDIIFNSSTPAPIEFKHLGDGMRSITVARSFRFRDIFPPQAPFKEAYRYWECATYMLSNLLGGLSYFDGDRFVDVAPEGAPQPELLSSPRFQLLSFVASRSAFPRGHLWDEGYHLLVVMEYDLDLATEVLSGWLALIDSDGWLGREQIFGAEGRSKVPQDEHPQRPYIANPPTFFMVIAKMLDIVDGKQHYAGYPSVHTKADRLTDFLNHAFPLMKKHYEWFKKTQAGKMQDTPRPKGANDGFRWRGATEQGIIPSGMDDYPRPTPPSEEDLHVDLISWIAYMADVLERTAAFIKREGEKSGFGAQSISLKKSIEALHWSDGDKTYCDVTVKEGKHAHVCHKGYVSLMPFILGHAPPEHVTYFLDLLEDEKELLSPHGVRSLSTKDELYAQGDNYWRGPIWINMNYMILEQLLKIARKEGSNQERARDAYRSIREKVVDTVTDSWSKTGFAWEQYNPKTGVGQRASGFNGWTSLVVKIVSMPSLDEGEEADPQKKADEKKKEKEERPPPPPPMTASGTFGYMLFLSVLGFGVASYLMPRRVSMVLRRRWV